MSLLRRRHCRRRFAIFCASRDWRPTPTGQVIVDFLAGRIPAYLQTGLNIVPVEDVARGHILAAERGRVGERYLIGGQNITFKALLDDPITMIV